MKGEEEKTKGMKFEKVQGHGCGHEHADGHEHAGDHVDGHAHVDAQAHADGHDHAGDHDHDHADGHVHGSAHAHDQADGHANDEHEHVVEHGHADGHDNEHVERGQGHGHHHHGPGHHHHHAASNLKVALALNVGFALIELVGGLWTGSVAILSDAVHDLGDSLSLGLALGLESMSRKKSNARFSYGYRRVSLLSALITCVFLVAASAVVLVQAIPRLSNPVHPKLPGMIGFAFLGIAVNGYAAWRLHRGKTMNERVVSWHFIEDVMGWVAVLIGALVMMVVDLPIIDPILSIGFTVFLFWGVFRSLRETLKLFLQATPEGIDLRSLTAEVLKLKGVASTHDAHLWSLDGEAHVLTLHVVVQSEVTLSEMARIKDEVRRLVARRGKIHVTIELETVTESCPVVDCVTP